MAQPRHEGGFILDPEDSEAAVLPDLSALIPLGALTPLPFGIGLGVIRPSTSSSKAAANCAWKGRRTVDRRYFAEISGFATLRPMYDR